MIITVVSSDKMPHSTPWFWSRNG